MATIEAETGIDPDGVLELARELGVDGEAWYVRAVEAGARAGDRPDRAPLVRLLWELQRATGRADLLADWRRLADALDPPESG